MRRGQQRREVSGRAQARAFSRALAAAQPGNGAEAARRLDTRARHWRPRDVPKLRDALLKAWESELLLEILAATADDRMHLPVSARHIDTGMAECWSRMDWRNCLVEQLPSVEMFYVDADTTELVAQAAAAKPRYQLWEDKLPADAGLIVFEHPYCVVPAEVLEPGQRVELVAALWFKVDDTGIGGGGNPAPGVMLVTLQDTDVLLWTQPIGDVVGTRAEAQRAIQRLIADHGPLSYHEEYPLPFGDRPWGEDTPEIGIKNTAVGAALTAWILMDQRMTEVREEPPPRHQVERAAKTGRPRPKGVRVVTMRAPARRANPRQQRREGEASRTYTVRWPVTGYGYWRNTWYPSRGRHEEQFIEVPGYIKGPEGAPLINAERVNVLRSQ